MAHGNTPKRPPTGIPPPHKKRTELRAEADAGTGAVREGNRRLAKDNHVAGGGRDDAHDRVHRGGFSGAVVAEQRVDLASLGGKGQATHRVLALPARVVVVEAACKFKEG